MNEILFANEMERLHDALDSERESKGGEVRFAKKLKQWFPILRDKYPTSKEVLKKIVDEAIEQCDRTPSLKKILEIRSDILATLPKQNIEKTDCSPCSGEGYLLAWQKNPEKSQYRYRFAFRCPHCENGRKYRGLPVAEKGTSTP
ncbi:MAG: hypothetical protein HY538_02495 [Deltaproteobacteria bacterium]|nr:hypothetical protein [Deltaproteobacteria bacterium]